MDKSSGLVFINQIFPAEASIFGVEPFMLKIHNEIRRVDANILAAIRQQGNSGTRAKENLIDATCAAEELSHKIQEIKSKAELTKAMLHNICRDIKRLDFAKKNITTAVTALSRLTMLVFAVEQLQVMTSKRQYKEAATQVEELKRTLEFEMELGMKFGGGGSFGDDTKEIGGGGNNSQKVEETWDIEEESQTNILSSSIQLALTLGPRFYANIFRCKHISETGAQQMLLDAHDMKMILLKVPSLARQTATAGYAEFVNHQMKRAEEVLKVIASPIVSMVDTYHALFPEGIPMEFQRILELKLSSRVYLMISKIIAQETHNSRVAATMPEEPAPPLAVANPGAAVGFIANSEEVLTRAAEAATTSFMKLYSVTETAKDRPFRKLFNA
ncbi:unnamed protein product [Arabidopsis arenosa]|uniref:Vps53 N-terminal domain-containing protein n=1 Tax=Arabidopsis arenosa TaxID=38785 RepID=A0A8S1ZJ87_ARAAE|nr:unnamed protein product [Arabidopsis arenosa]